MDIKLKQYSTLGKISLLLFSLFVVLLIPLTSAIMNFSSPDDNNARISHLRTSSNNNLLVDKVYTFTVSNPILTFDYNINFEKSYYYHISVAIVTPHGCDMKISIFDPEGDRYDITHETEMEQDDYRKIPYGAALSGNHSFVFEAILSENLNIHIKIEKGEKVLENRIHPDEPVMYTNITKFKTGNVFEFRVFLKSDWYYKILIERVSTISLSLENARVSMDHLLWDPAQIQFKIYENETVNYFEYYFGTAIAGIYIIDIIVFVEADVECTNIAFAVIEKERIATILNPNDPDPIPPKEDPVVPDPVSNNYTESRVEYSIPGGPTIAWVVALGVGVVVPIIIVVVYRRRKNMGL